MVLRMRKVLKPFWQMIWPPKAPLTEKSDDIWIKWWRINCIAIVIPLTVILHYAIGRRNCLLNNIGPDYNFSTIPLVLKGTVALPWAIVLAIVTYHLGKKYLSIRILAAPVFLSFLTFSIWVWDIPFSSRAICRYLHDGRSAGLIGMALRGRHIFAADMLIYILFLTYILISVRRRIRNT